MGSGLAFCLQAAQLREQVPLLEERVESKGSLLAKGYAAKTEYLALRQALTELRGNLAVERNRLDEKDAAIDALDRRRAQLATEFRAEASEKLAAATLRIAGLEQELRKLARRYEDSILRAPVAGTVQQLTVHTVGGVASPAETLMLVVPAGSPLLIEAMVLNKDIGFVKEGQEARIKVESFPFTKYGLIQGRVVSVSADAIEDEKLGLVYAARVTLDSDRILVGDRWVRLSAGMSVSAEVKTGTRRVMEYFLSPFIEYQDEALRER